MAAGINNRDRDLTDVFIAILDRLDRLERPISIHLGGAGTGFTISVNAAGQLVATSDLNATVTVLALP